MYVKIHDLRCNNSNLIPKGLFALQYISAEVEAISCEKMSCVSSFQNFISATTALCKPSKIRKKLKTPVLKRTKNLGTLDMEHLHLK